MKCELCNNKINKFIQYPINEDLLINSFYEFNKNAERVNKVKSLIKPFMFLDLPINYYKHIKTNIHKKTQLRDLNNIKSSILLFQDKKIGLCSNCGLGTVYKKITESALNDYYKNKYWKAEENSLEFIGNERPKAQYDFLKNEINLNNIKTVEFGSASAPLTRIIKSKHTIKPDIIEKGEIWARLLSEEILNIYINIPNINNEYDLLLISHSLEHVADLNTELKKLISLVKKGGYIFIEIPNSYGFEIGFNKVNHFPHTYFFTPKTIEKIANLYNLEIIKLQTFGQSWKQYKHPNYKHINKSTQNKDGVYIRILLKK